MVRLELRADNFDTSDDILDVGLALIWTLVLAITEVVLVAIELVLAATGSQSIAQMLHTTVLRPLFLLLLGLLLVHLLPQVFHSSLEVCLSLFVHSHL